MQDLNLGGLDDDLDINFDDITTTASEKGEVEDEKEKIKENISEKVTPSENVANKDDLDNNGTPEGTSTSPDDNEQLSKLYSSLATHLHDKGVLPNLNLEDAKIDSIESLEEAIKAEVEKNAGELQSKFKEAMESGMSKDSFVVYQKTKEQLDAITEDVLQAEDDRAVNLRFNIIAQDFLNKGFSKEEASRQTRRIVELGEDVEEAKSALGRLKDSNEKSFEESKLETEKRIQQEQADIKKFIDNTDELFKGIKLTKNVKDKLYDQMVNVVDSNEDDKPLNEYGKAYKEDPVKFQVMQNYFYMLTKGFTDFSKINQAATTRVSKEIDDVLKTTGSSFFQNGQVLEQPDNNTTFSIGDGFDIDVN